MEETGAILAETLLRRNTQVGFAINVFFCQHVILTD
jgi:hypothetical protein